MRSLSATLLAAQKSEYIEFPLCKIALTRTGEDSYSYDGDDLLRVRHTERLFSHKANVFIDDNDAALHGIDLEGYQVVISYGATTTDGDEYSATAPLWVIGQQSDSHPYTTLCSLELVGTLDLLAHDKANAQYSIASDDSDTAKAILDSIADASIAPFDHCSAVTITYDTGYDGGDDLINSWVPADYFDVSFGESRLDAIIKILAPTNCCLRVEDDGELHIFKPTISGESYDYEYNFDAGEHNFLSKRYRRRIIFPNKVTVLNHPNQGENTGSATDASQTLIEKERYYYFRGTSNDQCESLAEAILLRFQLDAQEGEARIPIMNFGQEIMDYVNVTDPRTSDNIAGNITWLTRNYGGGKMEMDIGFGKQITIPLNEFAGGTDGSGGGGSGGTGSLAALYEYINEILDLLNNKVSYDDFNKWYSDFIANAWFRKLTVVEQLLIPTWT